MYLPTLTYLADSEREYLKISDYAPISFLDDPVCVCSFTFYVLRYLASCILWVVRYVKKEWTRGVHGGIEERFYIVRIGYSFVSYV